MDKIRILRGLELLLKIRHQELKVWCLANNLRKKWKILYVWIQIKRKYISRINTTVFSEFYLSGYPHAIC